MRSAPLSAGTPRVLLFTGKGGVGKTTASAATAAAAAARGSKTLVLSTDAAHSLADALATPLHAEPTEVDTGLYAMQVDTQAAFERTWRDVQGYLLGLLERAGVDALQAEELTVLPGAEEVLALLELTRQVTTGPWDLVVVDCAPTGETLRLLALPEALSWYVDKVFPAQRRALRAVRPLLSRVSGPAVPRDDLFDAVERLHRELLQVRAVLTAPSTSVRVVLTPEAVVVAEARRTLTSLALYGYRVDALIANRVFPTTSSEPFLAGWAAAQASQLAVVRADAGPLPVLESPYRPAEPVGLAALVEVGEALYGGSDPGAPSAQDAGEDLVAVARTADGFELSLALPLARRDDLQLSRSGDELVLTVAGHRRVLGLPSALRRCLVAGAVLADGRLLVRFEPDPALWRQS
ncbi:MAG: Arsenical pump-driving ATPase TEMP [uncultured Frankineae bacterium]|uniref:arsenite-transporting ATPase n=1 Tax=uncultured Frankineae bacterium TaxID=437475 RepID=A0A6J4LFY3_9ACTN|nr:MAG: Arsenical pump-driving ATPase TEMP [uncultured Frankineae bacterium]